MKELELKKLVHSTIDNTIKYIFYTEDKLIIEFSYINKNDGKNIICCPVSTFCNIGCKFCHTAEYVGKIKNRNLTSFEISNAVDYIYNDLKLSENPKTLLISFMGIGEIVTNVDEVVESMFTIRHNYMEDIHIRFAFATSLPEYYSIEFFKLANKIAKYDLEVKLHLSLHYTTDELRSQWMPMSMKIEPTIAAVDYYKAMTGNDIEIHYTLIDDVNDKTEDAIRLSNLIKGKGYNVKFLFYNKKDNIDAEPSNLIKIRNFADIFSLVGIKHEYYVPPGLTIGASCGQLSINEYIKSN